MPFFPASLKPVARRWCQRRVSGRFKHSVTVSPQLQYSCLDRWLDSAPPELRAVRPCACEPRIDSFSNNPALELRECTKHLKHRLASASRGIESLLMKK